MIWTDIGAEWRGPVKHHSGLINDHMYVVIHTADGSLEGTISWQKSDQSDNSSHFIVDYDGKIAQVNDTINRSGAQKAGNPYSIAIENAGNENRPLTEAQLRANAKILAKAHIVHGIPLQVTNRVGTRGLGHHSMGYESGVDWGHQFCPGEIIKAQKQQIVDLAKTYVRAGGLIVATERTTTDIYNLILTLVNGNDPADGSNSDLDKWIGQMQSYGPKLDDILTKLAELHAEVADIKAVLGSQTQASGDVSVTGTLHLG
jgi:hypothetical protein